MKRQKLLSGTNTAVLILVILGFIAFFNYLGSKAFVRLDLTEGKEFTISPSTKQILKNMDDIIRVEVYFSKKLPHQFQEIKTQIQDLLKEFEIYSRGNLTVTYLDPAEDKDEAMRVQRLGVPQVQANIIEKDQRQTINVYLGMGIFFEDKKEVIPVIQNLSSLEYDVTSAIKKVSSSEVRKVGFLSGHGEHNIYEDYQTVRKALEKQYEVRAVETKNGTKIPSDINTIVVAGADSLAERDLFEIDQFIMNGGKAVFLVDEVDQGRQLMAAARTSNLNRILNTYGARVNQDFVLDVSHEMAGFNSGFFTFSLPYPLWPRIIRPNMAENHITEKLEVLSLPWISSIVNTMPASDSARTFTSLATTTEKGWTMNSPYNMNPQQQFMPVNQQKHIVAALIEGTLPSAFAGRGIPPVMEAGPDGKPVPKMMPADQGRAVQSASAKTAVIIVGDSDFITDQNLQMFRHNLLFFQNAVDYLTLDESLIAIRSRGKTDRPLKELSEGAKNAVKFFNIFGMSILVIAFGLIRYYLRKKRTLTAAAPKAAG